MTEVNKTLYIPLYGKASVSKKGIILTDTKAEEIWEQEQFLLKGKAASKWLAYFMSMRARVFDRWVEKQLITHPRAMVLHIGCGMDSRILRVGRKAEFWYDVDFPEVIEQRRKYYEESETYRMWSGDASQPEWISKLSDCERAIVVLEGISMYLHQEEVTTLFLALQTKFAHVHLLMDVYTTFGAKASKYKNPINEVGVSQVYGIDDPESVLPAGGKMVFIKEHTMTPKKLVEQLQGMERRFFRTLFAGAVTRKMYRLFEYETKGR